MHTEKTNNTRRFFNLWLTLFVIWLFANSTVAPEIMLTGVLLATLLATVFAPFSDSYTNMHWSPRVLLNLPLYCAVFLGELVKANINVLLLVLSPRIAIQPGIIEIKTTLTSPVGRLVLANSITLTPGTLVVDIKDDTLFIHWINVSSKDPVAATQQIAGRFEKYLKVIYG